jgi:hypothetical protein
MVDASTSTLTRWEICLPDFFYGIGNTAGDGDVIVLDQHTVIQAHAVVVGAAHAYRVFFQHPPARGGLAGIHQLHRCSGDLPDIIARLGGDAGHALKKVQGGAFTLQQGGQWTSILTTVLPAGTRSPSAKRASKIDLSAPAW